MLNQQAQQELFPRAMTRGVAVIVAGVSNSGILADPQAGATFDYEPAPDALVDRARTIAGILRPFGVPLATAALQFPLRHPAVSVVLSSARSVTELRSNIAAFDSELPAEMWSELEEQGVIRPVNGR